jgi:hypothetical protein
MQGIRGYSRPSPNGVTVDTQAMMVDLITVLKGGGVDREQAISAWTATWDQVDVTVSIPANVKN